MADAERSKVEGDAPRKPVKQREELDQLLQRIAAHIAEVDKGDNGSADETATAAAASDDEAAPDQPSTASKPPRSGASLRRAPSSIEPPALRSAVGGSGSAKPGRGSSAPADPRGDGDATPGGEDSEKAISDDRAIARPVPGDDASSRTAVDSAVDEPWDDAAAEALTRTFEADLAVPPLRSMLEAMGGSAGSTIERRGSERRLAAPERGQYFEAGQSAHQVEAAQGDLIQAARRVEAMLDRLAPREAVDALGARFTTLESEVGRTGVQLKRLDGIEARLGELGDKLSDAQVVALFGSLVPTAEDLTQFAEDAAGRAAERVLEAHSRELAVQAAPPDTVAGGGSSSQLKALGELLAAFMDERRRSDAGTLEALETLQLAMQHVLDRIDRVEDPNGLDKDQAAANPPASQVRDLDEEPDDFVSRTGDTTSAGIVNLTADQSARSFEAHAYRMPEERPRGIDTIPDARGYDETAVTPGLPARDRLLDPIADQSGSGAHDAASRLPGDLAMPQHAGIAEPPPQPISDRQAFIAMARRAAERAKTDAGNGSNGELDKSGKGRVAVEKAGKSADGQSAGIIRPGVIAIAAGAVVLALLTGYWFLMGQRAGLPNVLKKAEIERSESAQPARTKSAVEDQDSTPPADQSPAGPSKISDEAPSVPAPEQQEASAVHVPDAAGPGMAVAFGQSPATFDTVMQARERARLASLSHRTAFTAARSHGVPHEPAPVPGQNVSAIETASVGTAAPASRVAEAPAPAAVKDQKQQLILPPAAAGPLSLRLAAAQGDAAAQLEIATRLAEGKGIKQNFSEAATWYERAAAQGQPIAQYRLATLYERGMGVKADRGRARTLYESAAEQGNLKAMHNLAVISTSPVAGNPDYDTAAALFSRAASYGLADSQYNLGVLYESGLGVPKDHAAAYKWYSLAARGGDADAARRRDSLISRLPPETLQAMDQQIAAWRPAPADERANNPRAVGPILQQHDAKANR